MLAVPWLMRSIRFKPANVSASARSAKVRRNLIRLPSLISLPNATCQKTFLFIRTLRGVNRSRFFLILAGCLLAHRWSSKPTLKRVNVSSIVQARTDLLGCMRFGKAATPIGRKVLANL